MPRAVGVRATAIVDRVIDLRQVIDLRDELDITYEARAGARQRRRARSRGASRPEVAVAEPVRVLFITPLFPLVLRALVFDDPIAEELSETARREGLLLNAARPHVLRFMPELRATGADIRHMQERLRCAYAAWLRAASEKRRA